MTTKSTQRTQRAGEAAPAGEAVTKSKAAPPGQPGPWDQPWHHREDSTGWETVYRGTGRRREITSSLVLDLTREQNEWVDRAAEAAGVTPHAIIKKLIDAARAADEAAEAAVPRTGEAGHTA